MLKRRQRNCGARATRRTQPSASEVLFACFRSLSFFPHLLAAKQQEAQVTRTPTHQHPHTHESAIFQNTVTLTHSHHATGGKRQNA